MSDKYDFLQYGNNHAFDPEPMFFNHQCHWAPWADHYQSHEGHVGTLAKMLGSSLEENKRLLKRCHQYSDRHVMLFWAFIHTVERLPKFFHKRIPVPIEESQMSIAGAWKDIQLINKWRAENKLNIKEWDVP